MEAAQDHLVLLLESALGLRAEQVLPAGAPEPPKGALRRNGGDLDRETDPALPALLARGAAQLQGFHLLPQVFL